eukprot:CAMPEP_0174695440 /NCGR_PEP_ID=MMETSP1094-20130205/1815_1 /TAXON_ID=156173 /ORGANISM="Chrysochromulina brevifilum, Strain UTEX LB 985" /LENGTH=122 /DNA_ID=CAMNT_0015891951 /DNA_START=65 /DNA_END=433 /DNA_ORIENTATION=-
MLHDYRVERHTDRRMAEWSVEGDAPAAGGGAGTQLGKHTKAEKRKARLERKKQRMDEAGRSQQTPPGMAPATATSPGATTVASSPASAKARAAALLQSMTAVPSDDLQAMAAYVANIADGAI